MSGATLLKMPPARAPEKVTVTPQLAASWLERNQINRPLSQPHVTRIAAQIKAGRWRYNGETIKLSPSGDVLDGQHRLWAIIEANMPVEILVVFDVERDAFATIDTLSKPRSGGDVIALAGAPRYRSAIASALQWLERWQRGTLLDFKAPANRIENSDIEESFRANPAIVGAVEQSMRLRSLANPSLIAFIYYAICNRAPALAERMLATLADPAGIGIDDPFYRLRAYFTAEHHRKKDPLTTIALAFKAANAAQRGAALKSLSWRSQGANPEAFPALEV